MARRRRRWGWRVLRWTLGAVLVLVLLVGVGGVWAVRHAAPEYDDAVKLPGLTGKVTVYRDDHGIPQLYADNADDLFRAQGYVHAQERFWEMDFRRHVTSGRLSELFGAGQVDTDKFLRTMGWRHVAEQEWSLISEESRRYLTDYAAGVNAYLAGHGESAISLEYSVLKLTNAGYPIEKWDPVDSLAWLKAMAYDLWGNVSDEIDRATLLADGLTQTQVEQLYPAYPFDDQPPDRAGRLRDRRGFHRRHPGGGPGPGDPRRGHGRTARGRRRAAEVRRGDGQPARVERRGPARHRLQLVRHRRQAHRDRQAAARQRPAPVAVDAGHLVPDGAALRL